MPIAHILFRCLETFLCLKFKSYVGTPVLVRNRESLIRHPPPCETVSGYHRFRKLRPNVEKRAEMIASQKAGIERRIAETNTKLERVTISQVFAHLNVPPMLKLPNKIHKQPNGTSDYRPKNLAPLDTLRLGIIVR